MLLNFQNGFVICTSSHVMLCTQILGQHLCSIMLFVWLRVELYLVVDDNEKFHFSKMQDTFPKPNSVYGKKSTNGKSGGRGAKGVHGSGDSGVYKLVKIMTVLI